MAGGPDDLFDLCAEWLAAIQEALVATEGGQIDRAYVSPPGMPPSDDCEQLTVSGGYELAATEPNSPALAPGFRTTVAGGVILATLTATIMRCVPVMDNTGDVPPIAMMEAASTVLHADLWAILNYTWQLHAQGLLFPPRERELFLDPAVPLAMSGGFGGWRIQVRVALPGFRLPTT